MRASLRPMAMISTSIPPSPQSLIFAAVSSPGASTRSAPEAAAIARRPSIGSTAATRGIPRALARRMCRSPSGPQPTTSSVSASVDRTSVCPLYAHASGSTMAASAAETPGTGTMFCTALAGTLTYWERPPGSLVAEGDSVPANVLMSLAARGTPAARHQRVDADTVAHDQVAWKGTVRVSDVTGELVAEHGREGDVPRLPPREDSHVRAAEQGGVYLDEHLARFEPPGPEPRRSEDRAAHRGWPGALSS